MHNLNRSPLPCFSHFAFQWIVQDPIYAGILYSGVSFLISVALMKRISGPYTCILYLCMPHNWVLSYSGLSEHASIALLLVTVMTHKKYPVLTGALCGLNYLNRPQMLAALLCASVLSKHRTKLLASFLLTVAPWGIRNMILGYSPFFSFSTSRNLFIGISDIELSVFEPNISLWLVAEKGFFNLISIWIVPHLILWAFCVLRKSKLSTFTLWFSVFNYLIVSIAFHQLRFYAPTIALACLLITAPWIKYLSPLVFIVPMALTFTDLVKTPSIPYDYATLPDTVTITSNDSLKVALLNDCLAIRLPEDPKELEHIPATHLLYNEALMSKNKEFNAYEKWPAFLESWVPIRTMENGAKLYIISSMADHVHPTHKR